MPVKGNFFWVVLAASITALVMTGLSFKISAPAEYLKENILTIIIWMEVAAVPICIGIILFREFRSGFLTVMSFSKRPASLGSHPFLHPEKRGETAGGVALVVFVVFTSAGILLLADSHINGPAHSREFAADETDIDLYSWKHHDGSGWRYLLVSGDDRRKSPREILADRSIAESTEQLEGQLAMLQAGDQVIWQEPQEKPFGLPSDEIRQRIVSFAKRRQIRIAISQGGAAP